MTFSDTSRPSLRRMMLAAAVALAVIAVTAVATFMLISSSISRGVEASTEQLMGEQKVADQIVSASYSQQVLAYRYLEQPDSATLDAFRQRGTQAYDGIRRYLFRQMPLSARLKVEAIKEAHQNFEVTAERSFDLAHNGERGAAIARVGVLTLQADSLERAVRRFIDERASQRAVLQQREYRTLTLVRWMMGAVSVVLALSGIALVIALRRLVTRPVHDFVTAVTRLGDDTGGARMPEQRYGEFQRLAVTFNHMADRIQASKSELASRNDELTFALDHLQRTQQQLVQHEKLSAMGEMLAGLAHELNNPLAGVLGLAECLKADLESATSVTPRQLLDTSVDPLVSEAHRAKALVVNLLHFARRSTPETVAVNLGESIGVAVGLRRHAFVQAGKTLRVSVMGDLYVNAQAQKLEHAVINIINNALDVFEEGKGSVLAIDARCADQSVVVTFDDDGPGFASPERVFEPFFTTKPVGKGTGLGLALVHQFVEEFGGTVTAENNSTGGARIVMRLVACDAPAAPATAMPTPACSDAQPVATRETSRPGAGLASAGPIARKRVLIVDDEPALRRVQARLLTSLEVDVETASSGMEAIRSLTSSDFDLVITDLRMPGEMSGADVVDWIARERPELADSVLVVTGDAAAIGPDGRSIVPSERVLRKPFSRDDYVTRVKSALDEIRQPLVAA